MALSSVAYVYYTLNYEGEKYSPDGTSSFGVKDLLGFLGDKIFASTQSVVLTIFILVLTLANWGVEAVKWKIVVGKVTTVTNKMAIMSILSGVASMVITPYKLGGYIGKILHIPFKARIRAVILLALVNYSQFLVTLFFGSVGLGILFAISDFQEVFGLSGGLLSYSTAVVSLLSLVLIVMYIYVHLTVNMFDKVSFLKKWRKHWRVMSVFSHERMTIKFLGLSFLRFLVIVFQYLVAFYILEIEVQVGYLFLIIATMFYLHQFLPTINILEFGLTKSAILLTIFNSFSVLQPMTGEIAKIITCVCFLIWIINIALPAVVGSGFVLRGKFLKE